MAVTLAELRALCDPPVRELRAYHYLVPAGNAARITARVQSTIQIQRLMVPDAIAPMFMIRDIRVGRESQIADAPGDLFAVSNPDVFMNMDSAEAGVDIVVDVEYVGDDPDGLFFLGAFMGRTPEGSVMTIPIQSSVPIPPRGPDLIAVDLDETRYCFTARMGQLVALKIERLGITTWPPATAAVAADGYTNHYFDPPRVVSLRVEHFPEVPYTVFYAVDEAAGQVVLEVGEGLAANRRPARAHCEPGGYVPEWWQWKRKTPKGSKGSKRL